MRIPETVLEWIVVLTFLALVFGGTLLEALWLYRQGWGSLAKSICFSALTNLIGYMVGGFLMFISFGIIFMMVFDKNMAHSLGGEYGMTALTAFGALCGPLLLMLCKRLFLLIFKMRKGLSAWVFSFVSSFAVIVISIAIPAVVAYFLYRSGPPK